MSRFVFLIDNYRRRWNSLNSWSVTLTLLLLLPVLAGCANSGSQQVSADGRLKLNIADTLSNPVFRIAKTEGFFDKQGIDANIITFATPAEGINSLFIKQSDIAFGADYPVLNAVSKGAYSIIASTGTGTDANAAQWKLFVRSDITEPSQLKGKKVSFLRGTFLPYLWELYLTEHGLTANDVQQIGQGGFDEAYVALQKGEIDAAWVTNAAMLAKFEQLPDVHELSDMSKTSLRLASGLIAPNELIQAHPEAVKGFLIAVQEAQQFIDHNPDKTADILYSEVKQPRAATLQDLKTNAWELGFTPAAYQSLTRQKAYMVRTGIIKYDFKLDDKLNLKPLQQAFPDRVTYTSNGSKLNV
ncbi:ABC transporter substrate-binding protein [Paenibacillus campi]|uniref:ABC transporter substrate-binding protein n=1 Tax=Paenibacillus campi TaxID=3106031 RepID=UPI002AFDDFC7|nr:ABC transporter substrate-binding protein [Paenibacillus sp. SGZ-1009]